MIERGDLRIYWKGHSTVKAVDNDFCVLVDPFKMESNPKANIILVTHPDAGHFDAESIRRCSDDSTCVVIPESMDESIVPCDDVEKISEGEIIDIFGVVIEGVPMYNDHHSRGEGLGYLFQMGSTSIYVAGDTGLISEASDLEGRVDLAFLPVEGVYTMDVEESIKMATRIKPETVIPYHYGEPFFEDQNVDLRSMKAELEDRSIGFMELEAEADYSSQTP